MEDAWFMVAMFGQVLGVYKDVMDINYEDLVEEFQGHLIHESQEH